MSLQQNTEGKKQISDLAIASLMLSCLSIFFGPPLCIAGIVCGHLARRQVQRNPELGGKEIALAGLIIGYVLLAIIIVLAILACCIWRMNTHPT